MAFSQKLANLLRSGTKHLLDIVFPIFCLGCEQPKEWLCADCRSRIPLLEEHRCPCCYHHITPFGRTCIACSEYSSLDGVFVASHYKIPVLAQAIHSYKYRFVSDLAEPLGLFLADALRRTDLPLPDFIIPVPLHPRRLRFRGFNQSELLARVLAQHIAPGIDISVLGHTLMRTRYTRPQMKAHSRKERLGNLKGAFALDKKTRKILQRTTLWLVDDVATTGTTLEECAKILKKAGARHVFGIVLAR